MPPSLRAFFVLAFLRAFLRVLSVSALKEALSLPELTRRPRLPVAANLENSRQWVSVGGLHFHTHRLHFRRLKARREHTPGGQKQESSTAAQAYALAPPTPRQSGARASPAKAECPARQQTGHRTRLGAKSKKAAQRLKHMRWPLLRRGSRVRGRARQKLNALLASKLATARAWDLKETFSHFWKYKSVMWAGGFLDYWCFRAMRSRLEPMKKVARMLRAHEPLILNWFRAKGEISNGAVEGLNNKIRVVTRRSYGFRTFDAMEIALYHTLGKLPEPQTAHRFC